MDRYAGLFSYPFPEKQSQVRVYPEQKIREQCVVHGFYDGCCPGFTYAGFFFMVWTALFCAGACGKSACF
jgi:hypothetical protein